MIKCLRTQSCADLDTRSSSCKLDNQRKSMICQTLCYLCWKLYQWHVKITKFICRLPEKKFREDGGGGRIYLKGIYCARWLHLPRSSWSPWISSISLTSVIFVEIFYKIFSKKNNYLLHKLREITNKKGGLKILMHHKKHGVLT